MRALISLARKKRSYTASQTSSKLSLSKKKSTAVVAGFKDQLSVSGLSVFGYKCQDSRMQVFVGKMFHCAK